MFQELMPLVMSSPVPSGDKKITIFNGEVYAELNVDKDLIYLGGQILKLRATSRSIKLVSIKSDGTTESTVLLASPAANYENTFRVKQVHYVSPNEAFLVYDYATSATARSAAQMGFISIAFDGTLKNSAVNAGTASTASLSTDTIISRPLSKDNYDVFIVYKDTTISTGATSYIAYLSYISEPSHTFNNVTAIDGGGHSYRVTYMNTSGVNAYAAVKKNIMGRGGFFYRNNSNALYLTLFMGYYMGAIANAKTLSTFCPNFNTYTTFNNVAFNILDHYILGLTNNGHVLTIQFLYDQTNNISDIVVYMWKYDGNTTIGLEPLTSSEPTMNNNYAISLMSILQNNYNDLNVDNYYVLNFQDDILLIWDSVANIYYEIGVSVDLNNQIVVEGLFSATDAVTVKTGKYYEMTPNLIGRGSNAFNCVFAHN